MKKILFTLLILISLFLTACQSKPAKSVGEKVTVNAGSYISVSADELRTMLKNKDFLLINVHIPFAGDIAHTDVSIPYDEIEQNLAQLPTDKNAKIVLYCRSGRMSQIAAEKLISLGYTNIWDLKGGMAAWEQAGYEIQR
jgi:rhodanese-related sulfurtransferase